MEQKEALTCWYEQKLKEFFCKKESPKFWKAGSSLYWSEIVNTKLASTKFVTTDAIVCFYPHDLELELFKLIIVFYKINFLILLLNIPNSKEQSELDQQDMEDVEEVEEEETGEDANSKGNVENKGF